MVKRHKRRKFSGRVCEQIVYTVAGGTDPKISRPKKPRFQTREEQDACLLRWMRRCRRRHWRQSRSWSWSCRRRPGRRSWRRPAAEREGGNVS